MGRASCVRSAREGDTARDVLLDNLTTKPAAGRNPPHEDVLEGPELALRRPQKAVEGGREYYAG